MSRYVEVRRVLEILGLNDVFDFVATRDDVERGKPDPEIYLLVQRELGVPSKECLVVEDSPSGVRAALAAGMWCIAVTTPFTRERIHEAQLLDERWVVDDPTTLMSTVRQMYEERKVD
jgi:beta-phosphoglucomutase-like phosphatase (HAD superfamily)